MSEIISLRQVRLHSKQTDIIRIYDSFDLVIRPWTPEILSEAMPIVAKIINEFKHQLKEKETKKDESLWEILTNMLNRSKEFLSDVKKIVYLTLLSSNEKITITIDEKDHEQAFFSEIEINSELEISYIMQILKIIYEQNYVKNLLPGLNILNKQHDDLVSLEKNEKKQTEVMIASSQ